MTHKARFSVTLLVTLFLVTFAFAGQNDGSKDTQSQTNQKQDKKKPKNSNVDDIGNRDVNKGNILPTMSLEKEMALGRQLDAEVQRQVKLVDDHMINEYV